jgi:hypothetical protein
MFRHFSWTPAFAGATVTRYDCVANFGEISMSEFGLPANSKVGERKHWALRQPAEHVKSFRIYRWEPAKNAKPDNGHLRYRSRSLRADGS